MQYFKLFNDYESKTISWGYALILQNPFCFVLHLILQALLSLCVHFISGLLLSNQWNNWNLAQGISPTFIITQFLTFLQYVYAVIPKFCFLNSFIFILCSQAKEVKKARIIFQTFPTVSFVLKQTSHCCPSEGKLPLICEELSSWKILYLKRLF